ncbi:MAG: DUF932 domain-containing protein [Bacteroidales bacterium]|nr:DUF932 domain-containing protein [Bacteroidales bacterium]
MSRFIYSYGNPQIVTKKGTVFNNQSLAEVEDFLLRRRIKRDLIKQSSLKLFLDNSNLILEHYNGGVHQYPVRQAFLNKLLNWFSLPAFPVINFSPESIVIIANEILRSIRSDVVLVTENDEALTILSPNFTVTEDIQILNICGKLDISHVYRDDFMTRAYFQEQKQIQPQVGDIVSCRVHLLNSETGFSAFELAAYLFRLVCKNGAVHKVPLGMNPEKFYHHGLNYERVRIYIDDFVEAVVPFFDCLEEKMNWLSSRRFDEKDKFIKDHLSKKIPAFAWNNLIKGFHQDPNNLTYYDFYNHITSTAKSMNPGSKLEYEKLAGLLTELSY